MKKPVMIFAALMMSLLIQTAAHAEWIDARVTSINNTNQTMQVQHKTSAGISETMTVKVDKNVILEGYQGIGDVKSGDRVRLNVEGSFLGTKRASAINASDSAQANPSDEGPVRSGVAGPVNQGLDGRLSAGASARTNVDGVTDLPAGNRSAADANNIPTNNNPPRPLLVSPTNPGASHSANEETAGVEDSGGAITGLNTQKTNTGKGI